MVQDARLAIRDVYDAIVELVTNSDDRYQILGTEGRVEIELGRQGKGKPSILRVRDFADGMTTDQMNRKLGRIGGRVSGMEEGKAVRGTNSRGAKDIAALGRVTFESIAGDGRMHTCRIFPNLEAERYADVNGLQFERKSYRIRGGSRRTIRLLAPVALARSAGREFDLELSSDDFRVSGARKMVLRASLGVAVCKLTVALLDDEAAPAEVTARLGEHEASGGGGRGTVRAAAAGEHRGEPAGLRWDVVGRLLPALRPNDVGVSTEGSWVDGGGGVRLNQHDANGRGFLARQRDLPLLSLAGSEKCAPDGGVA